MPAIAAIVHEPALLDDAEQNRAARAVAALALENERLKAELRVKVEELSASRARIVESRRARSSSRVQARAVAAADNTGAPALDDRGLFRRETHASADARFRPDASA